MRSCQLLKAPYSYAQTCYFRRDSRHVHGRPRKGVFYLTCSPCYTGCTSNVWTKFKSDFFTRQQTNNFHTNFCL